MLGRSSHGKQSRRWSRVGVFTAGRDVADCAPLGAVHADQVPAQPLPSLVAFSRIERRPTWCVADQPPDPLRSAPTTAALLDDSHRLLDRANVSLPSPCPRDSVAACPADASPRPGVRQPPQVDSPPGTSERLARRFLDFCSPPGERSRRRSVPRWLVGPRSLGAMMRGHCPLSWAGPCAERASCLQCGCWARRDWVTRDESPRADSRYRLFAVEAHGRRTANCTGRTCSGRSGGTKNTTAEICADALTEIRRVVRATMAVGRPTAPSEKDEDPLPTQRSERRLAMGSRLLYLEFGSLSIERRLHVLAEPTVALSAPTGCRMRMRCGPRPANTARSVSAAWTGPARRTRVLVCSHRTSTTTTRRARFVVSCAANATGRW